MLGQLDDHAFLLGRRDEDVGPHQPVPGRIQRISASTPSKRPVTWLYTGWYSTWNSPAAIARRNCSR